MGSIWNGFVGQHPFGHLLQTDEWAKFKRQFGWEEEIVQVGDGADIEAGATILYRWLPHRLLPLASIAYTPKGPVVDWRNTEQVGKVLNRLEAAARRKRAVLLHIEPNLEQDELPGLEAQLKQAGFKPAAKNIQPRRTILLDIGGEEEDVLGRMKQKTRYNIRLAARKGVTVREGTPDDLPIFNLLMAATGKRNQFGVHSPAYYQMVFKIFAGNGAAGMLLAEYEGRPLAAIMVFALGATAWYFYGASNDEERNRMPTYLLQWEGIRWARARGCTLYDLWGVPDEDEPTLENEFENRQDGLWGVYRFKRGFGGRLVRWAGGYERVFNRPLNRLLRRFWN